ncbi:MAG: hypothetical protein U0797_14040 [Gemmataceae bacterium]
MKTHTIRDLADARRLLSQGLWWQRVLPPSAATVRAALSWAKELVAGGQPLPPVGVVADVGHAALGDDWDARPGREQVAVPNLPMNVVRTYEDHVLGKLYADHTFGRASDALHKYQKGRDQSRGLAYLLGQFRERARFDGVELPVGSINALLETPPEEILAEAYESMRLDGPHPLLPALYESLIQAARRTAEVLAPEDIFDLERKAALEELGQRLAHRQVLRAAATLDATLPKHKVRPLARRMEVPTRILDEDTYPVGGFTSVSNRGTVESLLHSQLAYMETDQGEHPDLFDTLFLMDELLYYSRDENQFRRRRRTFALALNADLVATRFKDLGLPYQRDVMLLGLIYVLVKRLAGWLSTDALNFQVLFLGTADPGPLANERGLLEKLFYEEIALGILHLEPQAPAKLAARCEDWSRRSMVHCLVAGVQPPLVQARDVVVTRLAINAPRPSLGDGLGELNPVEGDDAADSWANALQQILMRWI